jgi:hypothetical protein
MRLTKAQREFLIEAEHCSRDKELDGIAAKGSRRAMAVSLKAAGLLRYVGEGPCVDDEVDAWKEWPIYAITDAGREALASSRRPDPRDKE